ncbi:HD domain-containing protein [Ruminococcaceae bacterium OttesenSCG-928-D13]|nr:HD domain-containing protein [Ruminococcaceae bacterium OttesenSCG-928-D13]
MTKKEFGALERVMLKSMQRSVHDTGHIYRVLYYALRIAKTEPRANLDVVITAALLHDIGRAKQDDYPGLGHAELGARMAWDILRKHGTSEKTAAHVRDCIRTHSYKGGKKPATLEAKILFDADKLDLTGAVGSARALLFGAEIDEPFYLTGPDGQPTPGKPDEGPSLLREYNRKLKHLHTKFFTAKGRALAKKRQKAMDAYFTAFEKEIRGGYKKGQKLLDEVLG